MLRYRKGKTPSCLADLQSTPGAKWSSLGAAERSQIRSALTRDQGGLCAYCQRRLPAEGDAAAAHGFRIEHWEARSEELGDFHWRHLLGVCSGDTSAPERMLHCDQKRGNTPLFLHPVEGEGPSPRQHLRYLGDGTVRSDDAQAEKDVDKTLNLNAGFLKRARREVVEALRLRLDKKGFSKHAITKELEACALRSGIAAPEQAEVARYYLERWLRKK